MLSWVILGKSVKFLFCSVYDFLTFYKLFHTKSISDDIKFDSSEATKFLGKATRKVTVYRTSS